MVGAKALGVSSRGSIAMVRTEGALAGGLADSEQPTGMPPRMTADSEQRQVSAHAAAVRSAMPDKHFEYWLALRVAR